MRIDTYIYKTIYHTIMLEFDKENESKMNNNKDQTELFISWQFMICLKIMITPSSFFELILILWNFAQRGLSLHMHEMNAFY